MANDNDPRGLIPLKPFGAKDFQANYYRVSTANDIYLGQPVDLASTGYVVGIGTPTGVTQVIGVAVGFAGALKRGLSSNQPYLKVADLTPPTPTSDTGDRYILVADDPQQEFFAAEDTGGTALTLAEVGNAVDLLYRGAGSGYAVNGNVDSGWANLEIDRSSVVTTTGAFMFIKKLHDKVNTDGTENAVGNYGKWVVTFLHHRFRGANVVPPL